MSTRPYSAAILDSVSCNGCPKLIPLSEVRKYGLGNQADGYQCLECRILFLKARDAMQEGLSVFASDRPKEEIKCPVCRKSYEQLQHETEGKSRWFCNLIDGVMVMTCGKCSDEFARKSEAFRGTEYEAKAKLRGSK